MNPCESCRQLSCTWFAAIDVSQDWYLAASVVLLLFVLCQIFMLQTKKARIQVLQHMDFQGLSYSGLEHECRKRELFWKPSLCAYMQKACYSSTCQCVPVHHITYGYIWLYNVVYTNTSVKRTFDMHTVCIHTRTSDFVCTCMTLLMYIWLMQYTKWSEILMMIDSDDDRKWWLCLVLHWREIGPTGSKQVAPVAIIESAYIGKAVYFSNGRASEKKTEARANLTFCTNEKTEGPTYSTNASEPLQDTTDNAENQASCGIQCWLLVSSRGKTTSSSLISSIRRQESLNWHLNGPPNSYSECGSWMDTMHGVCW